MTHSNNGKTITMVDPSYPIAERLDRSLKHGMMLAVLAGVGACNGTSITMSPDVGGNQGNGGTQVTSGGTTSSSSSAIGGTTQTNVGGTSNAGGTTSAQSTGGTATQTTSAGGTAAVGGTTSAASTGGKASTSTGGKASTSVGGTAAVGGSTSATGGKASTSTGGKASTSTGGKASTSTGGKASTSVGGTAAVGGTSAANTAAGGTSSGGTSSNGTGPLYNPDFVEFSGSDCTVPDPKDANISTLNDLFLMSDGSRMTKKSDWRCQRAYLKKIVEKYIHGAKPGKPDTVTGTVSKTSISVHVEHGGKSIDFSVAVSNVPAGASGPVPIIIGMGAVGSMGGTASLLSTITAEGVATGNYGHQAMLSESSRSGLFTTIYGSTSVSSQIGWAWGISRVIDVLVAEKAAGRNNIIDPTAVGVTGCSRNGKGAFTVGAFDERIALGIPQESGTGGVSAVRMLSTAPNGPNNKGAEQLSSARTAGPAWFASVFDSTYSSKLSSIPGDMHSLLAMYAPRGLLVIDNSRIGELCSTCQHAASAAGQKLFEALGVGKNVGYHAGLPKDPQDHCSFNTEQVAPLQRAIRAHLTKKAGADGRIELQTAGVADLVKWIAWSAPALADDMSWDSPPVTSQ